MPWFFLKRASNIQLLIYTLSSSIDIHLYTPVQKYVCCIFAAQLILEFVFFSLEGEFLRRESHLFVFWIG